MPGSIQVSVLDFKELPSSSNSIKFSLGKVEHEVGENETYSFPLTNLRDSLIIKVEDSEGNQVSQSGVRTMSIIEKGTWDDVFPIQGGGLVRMKLQFFLSDEERNRIRLMRESAMKKKQTEILASRQEVSDVLNASSSQDFQESSFSNDISLKSSASFQGQSSTNVTDKREETSFPRTTQEIEPRPNFSNHLVEKLYEETLKEKIRKDANETNKKRTLVNTTKNSVNQLQKVDLLKRLQDSSYSDVGSSRLTVAEKIKSFSPKLAGEMDNQGSLDKTPKNIKKMISDFESTISQDRVVIKPLSTKSYRFGTSRLLKDNLVTDDYESSESSHSEKSSSSRLRNSFSTGDLRKNLSNIISKEDQDEFGNNFVEPSENMQSKGNDPDGAEKMGTEILNNKENLPKSPHEGANDSGQWKGEEKQSPESANAEASNGSFGQAMKIALVVGFGVLVFLLRQRESGKEKKKGTLKNQVVMNKRRSSKEQDRRIGVSRFVLG